MYARKRPSPVYGLSSLWFRLSLTWKYCTGRFLQVVMCTACWDSCFDSRAFTGSNAPPPPMLHTARIATIISSLLVFVFSVWKVAHRLESTVDRWWPLSCVHSVTMVFLILLAQGRDACMPAHFPTSFHSIFPPTPACGRGEGGQTK
jgi:hypothetical protein